MRKRGTSHIVVSPHDVDVLLDKSSSWACMLVAPNLHQAPINSLPWLFCWHLLNNRDEKVADFSFFKPPKTFDTMTRNTPPDYCESTLQLPAIDPTQRVKTILSIGDSLYRDTC